MSALGDGRSDLVEMSLHGPCIGVAGGIAILSRGAPQTENGSNLNLTKLTNGNREALLVATEDSVEQCLESLNLAQGAPRDVALAANKAISKMFSEVVYLSFNKKMNKNEATANISKTIESDIDGLKGILTDFQMTSLEKVVSSISEHPDMSRLRTH